MSLTVQCEWAAHDETVPRELTDTGALTFSPPDTFAMTVKLHICRTCWHDYLVPQFRTVAAAALDTQEGKP